MSSEEDYFITYLTIIVSSDSSRMPSQTPVPHLDSILFVPLDFAFKYPFFLRNLKSFSSLSREGRNSVPR